jgi:hypothetical protein
MKKVLLLLSLATILIAANCAEKNKMYSIGYDIVTDEAKENNIDLKNKENDISVAFDLQYIFSVASRSCDMICLDLAVKNSKADLAKKNFCMDVCIHGARDALNNLNPKMKLCH